MSRDPRLRELGAFLRARRGEISPVDTAASHSGGRRQVIGLRREEVAELIAVTPEYYTRIEQGRMAPSPALVRRLGSALELDDGQLRYALALLRVDADSRDDDGSEVDAALTRLLDGFVDVPALVIGPNTAILRWNTLAAEQFLDFSDVPIDHRSFVDLIFSNRDFQRSFRDLDDMKNRAVGILRASTVASPPAGDDAWPSAPMRSDADFQAVWNRHDVTEPRGSLPIQFRDRRLGNATVDLIVLQVVDQPAQRVLLFSPR